MTEIAIPANYRKDIIRQVFNAIAVGDSCSMVGIGSCGKSNIARLMVRDDVCQLHLPGMAASTLGVLVNCTKLSEYSAQALYRLMLEELHKSLLRRGQGYQQVATELEQYWSQATATESVDRVRRALEDSVDLVFAKGIERLFIVLDDFDHVVEHAPPATLNSLRALRDDHKVHLVYVTITRRELPFLRPEREFQDLCEIVTQHTIPVGPYSYVDAELMIDRLLARRGQAIALSQEERGRLLALSGRHPGLLRALFDARADDSAVLTTPDAIATLSSHRNVVPECAIIWSSLEHREQKELLALARGEPPTGEGLRRLQRKGILYDNPGRPPEIFSPLFADFVYRKMLAQPDTVILNPTTREVTLPGRTVKLPEGAPVRLFARLYASRGANVARTELVQAMMEAEQGARPPGMPAMPEARLEVYMARLKQSLDTPQREQIITAPDGGYRLAGPDR